MLSPALLLRRARFLFNLFAMDLIIILLVIGAVLMILETVLPGMVAGIVGFVCLIAGVILGYSRFEVRTGNLILLGVTVGLLGGFGLWVKFFPQSPLARRFVLKRVVGNIDAEQPELLSQTGVAYTQLRPSGTALINGKRVDVVTEGSLIERGSPIRVVGIEGMRVVVRAVAEEASNVGQS